MARATKSTLNKKLPVMSKIAFCSSAGEDMATKIFAGSNGKFECKVGFKQVKKTYPFQIQYRQRSRYTDANAKTVGATWNDWSDWKAAIAVGNVPKDGTETQYPADNWLAANKGINKKSTYITCYEFVDYKIPDDYDAREFQFRVRTFNKSKAKHGNWATETLTVYRSAAIADETAITKTDGGLAIKFNYIWDKAASVYVNSITDGSGRDLIKKPFSTAINYVELSATTVPEARQGYSGGKILIPIESLKRRIAEGEMLTYDIQLITLDGAITSFSLGAVVEPHREIALNMAYEWSEEAGVLTVSVVNTDAVSITSIGCALSYVFNSKLYTIGPVDEDIDLGDVSYFNFYPPIGMPFSVCAKAEDANDFKDDVELNDISVSASGYRLNKADDIAIGAVAWGNPEMEVETAPQYETALPYGREKNIIFYGEGNTTSLRFNATIVDKDNCYGGSFGLKKAWDAVRNNQGIYYFRTSRGELYKVGLRSVDIANEENKLYSLNVNMVEVV